ncbi:hypothetical protein HETIRDRAFT_162536 [Heterobasidion irregulare TC 32-1]|uniref:Uncharacterized protein n=1 Tax=Heterobasidion irregulare (strain TC 32-1) TaxID=747525 RepID=W4JRS0_HETIT|nr:uncharacterized protein HETIRDRAFT_162536 [Heterobasidion irregulare TC 32-1]ETW75770.1 hypothetical protein HETIRDRAFT_162536 [Heterobasidion irregulare TC 32-1]
MRSHGQSAGRTVIVLTRHVKRLTSCTYRSPCSHPHLLSFIIHMSSAILFHPSLMLSPDHDPTPECLKYFMSHASHLTLVAVAVLYML